jgi:hemolysin III
MMTAEKPRLRGVSHQYAFVAALFVGAGLVWMAAQAGNATVSTVYVVSLCALLGTSALYHRVDWSDEARLWMRRLDHSMIFFLIAGTYTPLSLLGLESAEATQVLTLVWGGSALGILVTLFWPKRPKWLTAAAYVMVGWAGISSLESLAAGIGWLSVGLIILGGVLYTIGALCYATHRPNPWPKTFGYHEIFHLFVIAGAAAHFAAVLRVVA